jgi:hypothetical protein
MSALSLPQTTSFKLYPVAESCLQNMHLQPAQQEIVRDCISRYSKPDTFCAVLKWIVFRVTELFKGKNSEWNTTKKMIQDHAMEVAIQQGLVQRNPQSSLEKHIEERFADLAQKFVDGTLDLCLLAQNRRAPLLNGERQNLENTELSFLIALAKSKIDPIRARSLNPSG